MVPPLAYAEEFGQTLGYDKPHELIRFENGDHHLSLYVHRLEFLTKSERFLESCLD